MKSFEELLASKFRFFKLSNFCWVGREGKVCEFLSFFLFFFLFSFFSSVTEKTKNRVHSTTGESDEAEYSFTLFLETNEEEDALFENRVW